MKSLFLLAAILLVTSEAADPHLILLRALARGDSGISRLDSSSSSSSSSSDAERCSSGKIRECTSCSTARICLPNGTPIATVNCSSFSPSTPFCDTENALCTAQQPTACGGTGTSFPCPSEDGIYPDPENCAQFHYCAKGIDTSVICPKNNVYDHDLGTCKLRKKLSDCVKFDCVRKEGEDILYPKDDRIWATCAGGKAYVMGRCKDYERYNAAAKKCSRVCRAVENQPIEDVCDRYIRCADIGAGNLLPYEYPCPPGQGFDKTRKICTADVSCPAPKDPNEEEGSEENNSSTAISSAEGSSGNEDSTSENTGESGVSLASRINNSGNWNSGNNVANENDEVNENDNENDSNTVNIGSVNRERLLSRIINNSGNNNANNSVENGADKVIGNLINGNNNGNNQNLGISQGRALASRINNSGNENANNSVSNGNDETNGNLVNGNDNIGNTNTGNVGSRNQRSIIGRIINNSGDNNSGNDLTNGDDSVNGNLINGNNNGNNLDSFDQGRALLSRINNSGNLNNANNVSNGDDKTNGNLVNGNNNEGNTNTGNVVYGNQQRRSIAPRIINNSGDGNSGNNLSNGNDDVEGNVINGNNNSNNVVDKEGSDDLASSQPTDDNRSSSADRGADDKNTPNLAEAIKNLVEWLKNKITNRPKSGEESTVDPAPTEENISARNTTEESLIF